MNSLDNVLIHHAYKNVWCAPEQDRQYIIQPTRITPVRGALGTVEIDLRFYNAPTKNDRYSVFTMGDILPVQLGMKDYVDTWVSAKAHCNSNNLLIDIYDQDGVRFPLGEAYFLYTRFGSLCIALKKVDQQIRHELRPIFIKWRSNAWFDGNASVPVNRGITVGGGLIMTANQLYTLQAEVIDSKTKMGQTSIYCNGQRIRDANITTVVLGDYVEYVRDASVKEVFEVPLEGLKSFDSILDGKAKYLITRAGYGTTIDFRDDVEIHLLNYNKAAAYRGRYYHQNHVDSIRMVTHRDISIPTAYVHGIINASNGWILRDDIRLEITIKNGGLIRPLVNEHSRIRELFKLPEEKRINAMVGDASNIEEWKARSLESSRYTYLMRAHAGTITEEDVKVAYGYNAISKIVADTPRKVEPNKVWVDLPFTHYLQSTVYEYNKNGELIDFYIHDYSKEYPIRNPGKTALIESYRGRGGDSLGTVFDVETLPLDPSKEYRFYIYDKWIDEEHRKWVDVTGDLTKYSIVDGKFTWSVDLRKFTTAIKRDTCFLAKNFTLDYPDKTMVFTVTSDGIYKGRGTMTGVMEIPPGELDVFLNKHKLVEDIDYYVSWPEIAIVNKVFVNEDGTQDIHVRCRGFCEPDLSRRKAAESGFVRHGILSKDGRFNLRDDRIAIICMAGSVLHRDSIKFDESDAPVIESRYNGWPYSVVHPIAPMKDIISEDTYAFRAISEELDKRVEDYMSVHMNYSTEAPNPMAEYYPVHSPYCSKLIHDMLLGNFNMTEFMGEYSDDFLLGKLSRYEWLLKFDPTLRDADLDFVVVHPHFYTGYPLKLNVYQYRLLDRTVKLIFRNKVELERNLVIVDVGFEHDMRDHPHPRRVL